MKATLLLKQKLTDKDENLKELVVWAVPISEKYPEGVRYRMAFIPAGVESPTVLYDNHHPKGHHKHIDEKETPYRFTSINSLLEDFEKDIALTKRKRR